MDIIADYLVRIKSALGARKESVEIPYSRQKEEITKIILAEGFIAKYEVHTKMNRRFLRLLLKYTGNCQSVIAGLRRVSKPGRRIYAGAAKLPRVQSGFGSAIVSTSKGLMTDETARRQKLGGEVICYVW